MVLEMLLIFVCWISKFIANKFIIRNSNAYATIERSNLTVACDIL